MSSQFQPLFTIQLLHDYYNRHDNHCDDFYIVPAEDSRMLMKDLKILYKNYGHRLLTVIDARKEINPTPPPDFHLDPFISFHSGMVLRFYMIPRNSHFNNITATSLNYVERKRFYFSNLSKNKVGTVLSLSLAVPDFVNTEKYEPGDLVKGADNHFYEAVRLGDGTAGSHDLNNPTYWLRAAADHPYVNKTDQVILAGDNYTYKLATPATNIVTNIFAVNVSNVNLPFDNLVLTATKSFTQQQDAVMVDLSGLKEGKYRLSVNGEDDVWIYVDPVAVKQNVSGIIEIHQFANVPADFQLLNSQNHIQIPEPVYTIRFKNRSVLWKYISQNGNIGVSDSSAAPLVFEPVSGITVLSQNAIGLKETPVSTLTATRTAGGKQIKNLKNPEFEKLVFEKDGNTGYYISNMYVQIGS